MASYTGGVNFGRIFAIVICRFGRFGRVGTYFKGQMFCEFYIILRQRLKRLRRFDVLFKQSEALRNVKKENPEFFSDYLLTSSGPKVISTRFLAFIKCKI